MSNRYSQYTWGQYNPLTMQELSLAPVAMRTQHDAAIAKAEASRLQLDPLKYHSVRAQELKNQMDAKIASQVDLLNKEGFNSNTTAEMTKLSREYQDLVGPMGEVGKINASKKVFLDKEKQFFEDAKSQNYTDAQAQNAWNNRIAGYTGYEKDGTTIKDVETQGAAKYHDYLKELQVGKSLMGQVETERAEKGYHYVQGENGERILVTRGGSKVESRNLDALNEFRNAFNSKWNTPTGEGYLYNKDTGVNLNNFKNETQAYINSMREIKDLDKTNENYQHLNAPEGYSAEPEKPVYITDPVESKNSFSDNDLLNTQGLGNKVYTLTAVPPKGKNEQTSDYNKRIKNIKYDPSSKTYKQQVGKKIEDLTPDLQEKIKNIYSIKKAQGLIPKTDKLEDYNPKTIEIVSREMKRLQNVQFSNQLIIPDAKGNSILASPQLVGKTSGEHDDFIKTRVRASLNDNKDAQPNIIYNVDGTPVSTDDVDIESLKLIGHYSPLNKLKNFGGNPDNSVSPHKISWKDKDGKSHSGLMARDASEMSSPLFRAAKVIKKTTDKAVDNEGGFISFNKVNTPELQNADLSIFGKNEKGLNGMRVKFNQNENSYTIELVDKQNKLSKIKVTPEKYQDIMYDMIE